MDAAQRDRQKKQMYANLKDGFGFKDDDIEMLFQIMKMTRSYIAGGFCLAAFLEKPLLEGQDLDLWVPTPAVLGPDENTIVEYSYPNQNINYQYNHVAEEVFHQFFLRLGYEAVHYYKLSPQDREDTITYSKVNNRFTKTVRHITNYFRKDSSYKIQLISTFDIYQRDNVKNFDLNICQFSVDWTRLLMFYGENPLEIQEISKGYMRSNPNGCPLTEKRKGKYVARGFKFLQQDEVIPGLAPSRLTKWF